MYFWFIFFWYFYSIIFICLKWECVFFFMLLGWESVFYLVKEMKVFVFYDGFFSWCIIFNLNLIVVFWSSFFEVFCFFFMLKICFIFFYFGLFWEFFFFRRIGMVCFNFLELVNVDDLLTVCRDRIVFLEERNSRCLDCYLFLV